MGWWTWHGQLVAFGLLSLVFVIFGHRFVKTRDRGSDKPNLNDRHATLIGQNAVLSAAIENGNGKVKIGDTVWKVTGPDLPKGASVVVTASENGVLKVSESD